MTAEEIRQDFEANYRSEDGLGRLTPDDTRGKAGPENLETVGNENGILFAAYFYALWDELRGETMFDKVAFTKAVWRLAREPGLYCRHPGETTRTEAPDNYAAIASMAAVWGLPFANDILSYGDKTGFVYDNTDPAKLSLSQTRQGGEIAFYKICAGCNPTLWELAWLLGGIALNAVRPQNTGETLLTWLRLKGMTAALDRADSKIYPAFSRSIHIASLAWHLLNKRLPWDKYFNPAHPIVRIADVPRGTNGH